jgi:hypothetical protein
MFVSHNKRARASAQVVQMLAGAGRSCVAAADDSVAHLSKASHHPVCIIVTVITTL